MAKINNAQVIQKLIDELKLYPGTDLIPTELAEKILPVYQINDQNVNVSVEKSTFAAAGDRIFNATTTIHTVAATPTKTFLTNASLSSGTNGALNGVVLLTVTPRNGSAVNILHNEFVAVIGTLSAEQSNSLNIQNPLDLEPGSVISITSPSGVNASGSVIGYTETV